ncbi:MAG: cyclic nucleotide-binding domain-containing protein [Syntrophales bacterium]
MKDTMKLKGKEIFDYLTPKQVEKISNSAVIIQCKAGEPVYERGEKATHFFIVLKGKVSLVYPVKKGMNVTIDELTAGNMFGLSSFFEMDHHYYLSAQCLEDSEILKIKFETLKRLMEEELLLGYMLQTKISEVYFKRYINAMKNLKAVVLEYK